MKSLHWLVWAAIIGAWACGSSTEPATETNAPPPPLGDKRPPTIANVTAPGDFTLVYFDTLPISFQVSDAGGVQLVTVERLVFADAANADVIDTIRLSGATSSQQTVRLAPPKMDLHPPAAQITIHAVDLSGNKSDSTFWVTFAIPPSIAANVTYHGQSTVAVPGDTVDLQVSGSSSPQAPLTWLGYRIGPPLNVMDSVAVTGTSATHDFPLVVSRDWLQSASPITYFAHNSLGDFSTGITGVNVVVAVRHSAVRVPIAGSVRDAAFDTLRNVLYLSQPDSDRILVFSLATNSFSGPIAIGGGPSGIDLSVSGDSLLVALRRAGAIGVIDLRSGAQSQIVIQINPGIGEGPENLRMSANGIAIVTMAAQSAINPSGFFEFDSRYQTVLPRTEPGYMAPFTTGALIVRSADRQKVLVAVSSYGSALYDAASNTFVMSNHGAVWPLSATTHAERFLFGPLLYDGSLNLIRQVASPLGGPTVLSGDGLLAYFGNTNGYEVFRTSDDTVVANVIAAPFTGRLLLTPTGDRLISINDTELVLTSLR